MLDQPLRKLERGSLVRLARELGINKSSVARWAAGKVPPERVLDVERITGIARHELRPDIYPPVPAKPSREARAQ